ncbi:MULTISPECIES: transglycosylase [Bacillus amyloliquefaciens group]|uniref:transglycosylase n=1 Tax=Bacillus amyloliquefaciens group TaxID=1938374 RepID=UPI001E4D9665|nr:MULTISPECIES: transglycosylase [Bacillus amyloliquefaciens group]UYQ97789.1 transglycosylase [Bacillus velezensis]UYQ97843.1 transglycosylase [Bacillus velezensis]
MEDLGTEHQTCVCDQCMTRLLIKGCSKIRKHDNGIKEHYIKCPRCKAEYTSFYTNEDIRRMQHRIRKMFALRRNMKKESAVDLYSKKIEAAQKEIQAAMSQLKKEMEPPHP